ncbi:MAG: ATP-binding cassette domain-containing protein [Lachnospiraceae bacterium]|nr:ATP-binding cassette domain-containing protein [Lachnospiraceae bacterium]
MILFSDVTKIYDPEEGAVLDHFSEKIEDGEFVAFTGRSGIGKTTAIRLLLKEIEPTEGKIFVDETELSSIPPEKVPFYRRKIGVIFQDYRLMQDRTVYENLSVVRMICGWSAKKTEEKIMHVLSFLGIDRLHKRYPAELSGGEQQKICLARAILNDPSILLADEPTGSLDPDASGEIFRLLELIHRQGTTVVIATHDIGLLEEEMLSVRRIPFPDN